VPPGIFRCSLMPAQIEDRSCTKNLADLVRTRCLRKVDSIGPNESGTFSGPEVPDPVALRVAMGPGPFPPRRGPFQSGTADALSYESVRRDRCGRPSF
jgi:hypothetical protein